MRYVMIIHFYPPRPGETVVLKCLKCHKTFSGSNPGYRLGKYFNKVRCPECASRRVVKDPFVFY